MVDVVRGGVILDFPKDLLRGTFPGWELVQYLRNEQTKDWDSESCYSCVPLPLDPLLFT